MSQLTTSFAIGGALVVAVTLSASPRSASRQTPSATTVAPLTQFVSTYCTGCHNGTNRSPAGPLLWTLDPADVSADPETWSRAYRQIQAGAMPPLGARRPDREARNTALRAIEAELDKTEPRTSPAPGPQFAERLARALWHTAPDAQLLRGSTALQGATAGNEARRLLTDDRAREFVARFLNPWLGLDTFASLVPNPDVFPEYDDALRTALARETELFLISQLQDDRDPLELWNAPYTFLDERLARHYAVPNVTGETFRRVEWPTTARAGLLGQGSILLLTSRHQANAADAAYSKPASRARWVREHFLGAALPMTFPGAQPVKPELPITPQTRALPMEPCRGCHQNFFPLGYALEGFDPLGRSRTHDQIGPVDASGAFTDGTPIDGPASLRQALMQYPDAFRTTLTERLILYVATGNVRPQSNATTFVRARRILRELPAPTWSTLIAAVARQAP